jgi:hypothetical protein
MRFLVVIILFLLVLSANAENWPTGARSSGMGNAAITLKDVWASSNNQGALGFLDKKAVGFHFENRFAVSEYSMKAFSGVLPVKSGTFGISLNHFGYSKYSETKIGLGFGKKLSEKFSFGIQIDYLNTYISNLYGNKGVFTAELGFLAEPVENLFIGGHIYNPTKSTIAEYNGEKIPTVMKLGMGYNFNDKVYFSIETEKDLMYNPVFKSGIEFYLAENFLLRAGISTNPTQNSFGIGYILKKFKIDFAFTTHRELGLSPHFSINYNFFVL